MTSSFQDARHHLEEAHRRLDGEDELSVRSRQALEILIDALLHAEFARPVEGGEVIPFRRRPREAVGRRRGGSGGR